MTPPISLSWLGIPCEVFDSDAVEVWSSKIVLSRLLKFEHASAGVEPKASAPCRLSAKRLGTTDVKLIQTKNDREQ